MIEVTNLLILSSDQHSKHMLGCYGNPAVKTPCPDAPAADGVCFDVAYVNCPVCVPFRASTAVGDYGSRHGYWSNVYAYDGRVKSWGSRLTEQGFSVTTIGKLHFKGDMPETGFPDQRISLHIKDGIEDVYGEICNKQITRPQLCKALEEVRAGEPNYTRYNREVTRRVAEFSGTEGSVSKSPFTLMAGFVVPHFPLVVSQEYMDPYPDPEALLLPVQFGREEWPHHPVVDDYRRYCCQKGLPDSMKRNAIRIYYRFCSFLDAQAGVVPKALEETGLDKNTRVLYYTDHGDTMGERGLFLKFTMCKGNVSIPMTFNGPGIRKGKRSITGASLVDVYPTAIECLGGVMCEEDRRPPGRPLLAFAGGKEESEQAVCSEYLGFGIYTGEFMLCRGRSKYIHYVGEWSQLFDLKEDLEERRDLTGDPEYCEVIRRMEKELRTLVGPEKAEEDVRVAQRALLDRFGGQEVFLKTFHPPLFPPIPDLEEKWIILFSPSSIR